MGCGGIGRAGGGGGGTVSCDELLRGTAISLCDIDNGSLRLCVEEEEEEEDDNDDDDDLIGGVGWGCGCDCKIRAGALGAARAGAVGTSDGDALGVEAAEVRALDDLELVGLLASCRWPDPEDKVDADGSGDVRRVDDVLLLAWSTERDEVLTGKNVVAFTGSGKVRRGGVAVLLGADEKSNDGIVEEILEGLPLSTESVEGTGGCAEDRVAAVEDVDTKEEVLSAEESEEVFGGA